MKTMNHMIVLGSYCTLIFLTFWGRNGTSSIGYEIKVWKTISKGWDSSMMRLLLLWIMCGAEVLEGEMVWGGALMCVLFFLAMWKMGMGLEFVKLSRRDGTFFLISKKKYMVKCLAKGAKRYTWSIKIGPKIKPKNQEGMRHPQ